MPTITTAKIHVKKANGEYADYDAISDSTTADRIARIRSVATLLLAQIEATGATIPSDYSTMSANVTTLVENCTSISTATINEIAGIEEEEEEEDGGEA